MMKKLYFLLFSVFLFNCTADHRDQQQINELISRIENGLQSNLRVQYGDSVHIKYFNIEERMKELNIPGVSIAVLYEGEIQWAKGYGFANVAEQQKVDSNTLFQAGSISKPIAATEVFQLFEENKIDLDTNINNYLKRWNVSDNEFTKDEKVTPRRLLNHSAGLTVRGFPGYYVNDTIPDLLGVLNGKGNTGPIFVYREPGERVGYSGGGYTVLQLMIEDVTQGDFSEIMQKEVLNPLGMNLSTYKNPLPEKYHQNAASGYNSEGLEVSGKWHVYPEMAAAGLWSTPSELLLWAKEIQTIVQTKKDGVLKKETIDEMLVDYGNNQGLGPYVVKHIFGHGGSTEGFVSDLRIWKDHPISVAIMVNSANGNSIIHEIFLSIAEEYNLPGIYSRTRKYKSQTEKQLSKYEGVYRFSEDKEGVITVKNNGLEFTGDLASSPIFLMSETDSTFFSSKSGTYFKFVFENDTVSKLKVARYEGSKVQ